MLVLRARVRYTVSTREPQIRWRL